MQIWDKVKRPPESALKRINGGRLSGMTDISPQWRYKIMTDTFGPCGTGWKYEIVKFWAQEAGPETMAFCEIKLYYRNDGEWSDPIPGVGGSMLTAVEKKGPYNSDECYKMALTDALSVAMKTLGVAADIYMGMWDGSKYRDAPEAPVKDPSPAIAMIKKADSLDALRDMWGAIVKEYGMQESIVKAKDDRKMELTDDPA